MESRPTGRRDGSAMRAGPSCHRTLDGFVRLTRSTETLGPRPGQTRMAGSMSAGVAHRQRRSRLGASSASKSPPNPSRTAPLEFRRPESGESVQLDPTSMSSRSARRAGRRFPDDLGPQRRSSSPERLGTALGPLSAAGTRGPIAGPPFPIGGLPESSGANSCQDRTVARFNLGFFWRDARA